MMLDLLTLLSFFLILTLSSLPIFTIAVHTTHIFADQFGTSAQNGAKSQAPFTQLPVGCTTGMQVYKYRSWKSNSYFICTYYKLWCELMLIFKDDLQALLIE